MEERYPKAELESLHLSKAATKFPFKFSLDYQVQINNSLTKIDQGIFKISIDQWFPHKLHKINAESRLLSYYPLYAGIDAFSYYLSFDQAIQLVNKENIDQKIESSIGIYELSIHQINEKTIALRSKYILKSHEIRNTEMKELVQLNKAALKAGGEGIIVRILAE